MRQPDDRFGLLEIVALLDRGGMGEVCRARDSRLQRDVALKVLPALLASQPDVFAQFQRESRAASALNHPNIVDFLWLLRPGGDSRAPPGDVSGEFSPPARKLTRR